MSPLYLLLPAYSSMMPLGSWTRDLILRVEHFSHWAETTHPPVLFWLAAFTFPTGFLTAVLQVTHALTYKGSNSKKNYQNYKKNYLIIFETDFC